MREREREIGRRKGGSNYEDKRGSLLEKKGREKKQGCNLERKRVRKRRRNRKKRRRIWSVRMGP